MAGATVAGRDADPEELLALGLALEGHADNLAAVLAGGACLTWEGHVRRVADSVPFEPVAVVPDARVETAAARAALPAKVSHDDATFTAGRAALLGAGLASGDKDLLAAAFADRLHEPYRAKNAPLLDAVRADAAPERGGRDALRLGPDGDRVGALGRGWQLRGRARGEVPRRAQVLALRVSALGAGLVA